VAGFEKLPPRDARLISDHTAANAGVTPGGHTFAARQDELRVHRQEPGPKRLGREAEGQHDRRQLGLLSGAIANSPVGLVAVTAQNYHAVVRAEAKGQEPPGQPVTATVDH
jgi:hypothetical protein